MRRAGWFEWGWAMLGLVLIIAIAYGALAWITAGPGGH